MTNFDMPSDLFRWCLTNTKTGSDVYSYEVCFPAYLAAAAAAGYLWETYDRRLQELLDSAARHGVSVCEQSREELDRRAPGAVHQGVIAEVRAATTSSPKNTTIRTRP